jgi:hypothetical protein
MLYRRLHYNFVYTDADRHPWGHSGRSGTGTFGYTSSWFVGTAYARGFCIAYRTAAAQAAPRAAEIGAENPLDLARAVSVT